MEMTNGLASCLIKVRQYHIGYPALFSHYPDGMAHGELTEIHEYVQDAMNQTRDIPESGGCIRRIVIGTGKYLIMGISGYAQHLAAAVQNVPYELVDFTGRGCPGFVGFVWNLEKTSVQLNGFPSLAAFGDALQEQILVHWEDSKNSAWACQTREGLKVPYKYAVSLTPFGASGETVTLNYNRKKIYSFDRSKAEALLHRAVLDACKKKMVSICTDLYLNSEEGSGFLNMTSDRKGGPAKEIENVKNACPKPVQESADTDRDDGWAGSPLSVVEELGPLEPKHPAEMSSHSVKTAFKRLFGQFGVDITSKDYSNVVHLVVIMKCTEEVNNLLNDFISRISARIQNDPYNFLIQLLAEDYNPSAERYEAAIEIPENMPISKFRELCQSILEYYNKIGVIHVDEEGHCAVETKDGRKTFKVCVMEKAKLFTGGEILLGTGNPAAKRPSVSKHYTPNTVKKEKSEEAPQTSSGVDPLIQQIKQANANQPAKKHSNSEDLFKL